MREGRRLGAYLHFHFNVAADCSEKGRRRRGEIAPGNASQLISKGGGVSPIVQRASRKCKIKATEITTFEYLII